jgi:hypothetical protein
VGSDGLIKTAASGAARFDHNPSTGESLGLLVEEARTNLQTYSNDFTNAGWVKTGSSITANATTAPDGTVTASKLSEDTSNGVHRIAWNYGGGTGASTATIFLKAAERTKVYFYRYDGDPYYATVDLQAGTINGNSWYTATLTPLSNGWYRASIYAASSWGGFIVALTNGTTNSYTGTSGSGVFIWGAQNEVGTFPTSYIPTVASTVTRAADVASMTGTNFSSWYNASAGCLVVNANTTSTNNFQNYIAIRGANFATNRLSLYMNSTGQRLYYVTPGSVTSVTPAINTQTSGAFKVAVTYNSTSVATTSNGSIATTTATNDVSTTLTTLDLSGSDNPPPVTRIASLFYYPARLSDTQLQALTAT